LLDYGADINALSSIGSTAIHTAFYFGTVGCVKALLYHEYPPGVVPQKIDVRKRLGTSVDG